MHRSFSIGQNKSPFDALPNLLVDHGISNADAASRASHWTKIHNLETFAVCVAHTSTVSESPPRPRYSGCTDGSVNYDGLEWSIHCQNIEPSAPRREAGFFFRTRAISQISVNVRMRAKAYFNPLEHPATVDVSWRRT